MHAAQIQGFFDIPTDNLWAAPVMAADIQSRHKAKKLMVVSPDVGGVVRARSLAKRLDNAPLAIVDKRRERAGESEVMNVIGDVAGFTCILVDDIVDSGGTLVNAAEALLKNGATEVMAYITHGVLSGAAFGIDQAAHRGALDNRGPTIAVLACAVFLPYGILAKSAFSRAWATDFFDASTCVTAAPALATSSKSNELPPDKSIFGMLRAAAIAAA